MIIILSVIPAHAGIQQAGWDILDSRMRGNDVSRGDALYWTHKEG
jgi:hypothetical protein